MSKRGKVALFQRPEDFDEMTFPALSEPAEVQVDLCSVLKRNEFNKQSPNVFNFQDEVFTGRPNIRPTLIAAGKLATAIILSQKYILNSLIAVAAQVHNPEVLPSVITPNTDDVSRVRKLINGRFRVGVMNTAADNDVAEYRRQDGIHDPTNFRAVLINPFLLDRIEQIATSGGMDDLRQYAALVATALLREVAHALHTMIRPDFFLESDRSLRVDVISGTVPLTPELTINKVMYGDFGELVEVMYFDGASVKSYAQRDQEGNKNPSSFFSTIALHWRQQNAWVDWKVADSDFLPCTYGRNGLGLFGSGIQTAKPVIMEFQKGMRRNQDGTIRAPPPGEYAGEGLIQEKISFDGGLRATRRLNAELATTERTPVTFSSNVPFTVPAADRVLRVRSTRKNDGTCH